MLQTLINHIESALHPEDKDFINPLTIMNHLNSSVELAYCDERHVERLLGFVINKLINTYDSSYEKLMVKEAVIGALRSP